MGILSGYKRFKKYLRTGEDYKLCSEWTNADSVEMADGTTLQESMAAVVDDVESTQNDITDVHNELKTSLGGMTFGVDAAGRYGYIKAGADTVTPFKKNDWETLISENIININGSNKISVLGTGTGGANPGPNYNSAYTNWSTYGGYQNLSGWIPGAKFIGATVNMTAFGYAGISNVVIEDGVDPAGNIANRVRVTIASRSTASDSVTYNYSFKLYVPT